MSGGQEPPGKLLKFPGKIIQKNVVDFIDYRFHKSFFKVTSK